MVALITDTKKTVTSIQKKILPSCDEFFVLTGYFYFSGFEEIYKDLKNKKMKIIIGMDYDGKVGSAANPIAASAIKELRRVKGIGKYSIAHIKCLMGIFDEIPIDSEVIKYAKLKGIGHNENEINDLKKSSIPKIASIAAETASEIVSQIINTEVNKSSVSAIVDDIIKKKVEKRI